MFDFMNYDDFDTENPPFPDHALDLYTAKGAHHSGSSWRNMDVTQPPVTAINFHHFGRRDYDHQQYRLYRHVFTIFNPTGITFGELNDWFLRIAGEERALTGEPLDWRLAGMSFCLVLPFQDANINRVLRE